MNSVAPQIPYTTLVVRKVPQRMIRKSAVNPAPTAVPCRSAAMVAAEAFGPQPPQRAVEAALFPDPGAWPAG